VSGINPGPNIGTDVHYSGTVMATLEAYHQKIPSIAVSLYSKNRSEKMDFDLAAEVAAKVASQIMDGKMKTDAIFNINVPNIQRDQIKGILITKTASKGFVTPAKSGSNKSMNYAFELEELFQHGTTEGTDIHAIQSGYISISLLRFEVDHRTVEPSIAECLRNVECDLLGNFG
jgi:5'-nucleotidase